MDFKNFSLDYLLQVIDIFDTTTDDYLFVYDYRKDNFHIAPHATGRFAIEGNVIYSAMSSLEKLVYPEDLQRLHDDFSQLKASGRSNQNITYRWLSKAGEPIWINSRGYVVRDDQNAALYLVGCINEVGESTQKADNLSGLLGLSSLRAYLSGYEEKGFPDGFFLRIGLDDLKVINARLGVEYGDIVLRKTGEFISKALAPGQAAFRIHGDEFLVVDFNGNGEDNAAALYRRLQQAVNAYIIERNYEAVFTVSAGFLSSKDVNIASPSRVLSATEFALDEAKRLGKNLCYSYREEDYHAFLKKRKIIRRLRQSVNHGFEGFDVYYQPLFNPFTGELVGAEALMRFQGKDCGAVSPAEFIPLLEETTLIIPAGRWILHEALKMCKRIKQFIPSFHISINLSYVQVLRSNI